MSKLKSTIDDDETRQEVRAAFDDFFDGLEPELFRTECFYEHGHWWARYEDDEGEHTYSVVDVEKHGEHSFDFEEV